MLKPQKIAVLLNLTAVAEGEIELPAGKTFADVSTFYVKWGVVHIVWKDGTRGEYDSNAEMSQDSIDWKHSDAELFEVIPETGFADYDAPLG